MDFNEIQKQLRDIAKELLISGDFEMLIGYGEGSLPQKVTPIFIRKPEEAEHLVFNEYCSPNLVTYLKKFKPKDKKIAIVTKACDNRSLVMLIKEKQIEREKIFIIGVECPGITISPEINKESNLDVICISCTIRSPVIYDRLLKIGERGEIEKKEEFKLSDEEIEAFEKMSPNERWKYFQNEIKKCIRCYACRNVCPLCYCEQCFVDITSPRWLSEGLDASDLTFYHLVRILHSAGRCGKCGACEHACPMGIRLRFLTRKMSDIIEELYGTKAGINPDEPPALGVFREADDNSLFK